MFLKNPRLLFKSNSFRLMTLYTILFVLSSLVINIYIYTVISSFIYEQSRSEIVEDLDDLAEIYKDEGVEAFKARDIRGRGRPVPRSPLGEGKRG